MKAPRNFLTGFRYPWRAARFILRQPGLYSYILIPLLINIIIFSLTVYGGIQLFDGLADRFIPRGDAWYWDVVHYLFWFIVFCTTAITVFFTFTVVGNLIAAPFNDLLSERTELLLLGSTIDQSPNSLIESLRNAGSTMLDELRKMTLFICLMLLLLLLNIIPGFGVLLYSGSSFLLTVWFLAIEYTGYVFARQGLSFREQRFFLRSHFLTGLGFGCAIFLLLVIPFIQFFTIPMGVVGATMLVHDKKGLSQ